MFHSAMRKFCMITASICELTCCLSAQVNNGSTQGVVTDATGAIVIGASVMATNAATGCVSSTVTRDSGNYSFLDLPAGKYKIGVSHPGFRPAIVNGVALDAASSRIINFALLPGAANDTVEVTGTEQQVNTISGDLSSVLEGKRIEKPQLNGRNYIQLVDQLPGAISTNLDPSVYNLMDGLGLQDLENDAAAIGAPGIETIAETRVLTALSSDNEGIGKQQLQRQYRVGFGSGGTTQSHWKSTPRSGSRSVSNWFNTAAYSQPTAGTLGNAARNALAGPGYTQTDMSIHKDFAIESV